MTFGQIAERAKRDGNTFRFEKAGEIIAELATACQALQDDLRAVKSELAAVKEQQGK